MNGEVLSSRMMKCVGEVLSTRMMKCEWRGIVY